jgi:hypothetical protein
MVKGRNVLEGEIDREEERCEVRRGFVLKEKVRQRGKGERARKKDTTDLKAET